MDEVSHSLDRLAAATERVFVTGTALSDAQAREPSLLPGWTRGHVLSHIARNADGMVNLLNWARTGTETPMYASAESRSADIEAGARSPATDLTAAVREQAARVAAGAAVPGCGYPARLTDPQCCPHGVSSPVRWGPRAAGVPGTTTSRLVRK